MTASHKLLKPSIYLTDGGLETTLIFHHGIELQHFAAFELLLDETGKEVLKSYYEPYLDLAKKYDSGFVLETPTWRANPDWAYKLGYSAKELQEINMQSTRFMKMISNQPAYKQVEVLVSGNIGPRGDGYRVENAMTPLVAKKYHLPQVEAFAKAGADVVSALTINYSDEAIGIVDAARDIGLPAVISFTLETDGKLPNGETLEEAILRTDDATDNYTSHFMINCAHPDHFMAIITSAGEWKNRIGGIRANASTKSHEELDACEHLDTGDKNKLADRYKRLIGLLPNLQVIGGCCGTDQTHIACIMEALTMTEA